MTNKQEKIVVEVTAWIAVIILIFGFVIIIKNL
jgi:hypothetical protein